MTERSDQAVDRSWRVAVALIVAAILLFAIAFGFLLLPESQRRGAGIDLWTAICRAAGINPGTPARPQPISTARALPVSQVGWDGRLLDTLADADREQGSQLALEVCASCHSASGVARGPLLPSLAGQSGAAIYKQLHDYRTGARVHPQMTPVARQLAERQLAEVAAYFASYRDPPGALGVRDPIGEAPIVRLATRGDPSRLLPACNSCHIAGSGGPIETPVITGQNADYLARQLRLYAASERRNDVYQRMRIIAAKLTDEEIEGLASYYRGVR